MVELVERRAKKTVDTPVVEAAGQVAERAKGQNGNRLGG
jgi:hypothetical protein